MVGEAAAAHKPSGPPSAGDFVIRHWRSGAPLAADDSPRQHLPATRPRSLDLGRAVSNGGDFFDDSSRRPRGEEGRSAGYISLRDLLDAPPPPPPLMPPQQQHDWARSPSAASPGGGAGEIRIRNRLVMQAAYAYLQPTPSTAESDRTRRRRALRRALAVVTCGLATGPLLRCIDCIAQLFRWRRRRRLF